MDSCSVAPAARRTHQLSTQHRRRNRRLSNAELRDHIIVRKRPWLVFPALIHTNRLRQIQPVRALTVVYPQTTESVPATAC